MMCMFTGSNKGVNLLLVNPVTYNYQCFHNKTTLSNLFTLTSIAKEINKCGLENTMRSYTILALYCPNNHIWHVQQNFDSNLRRDHQKYFL